MQEADKVNPELIRQLQDFKYLSEASQYSVESLVADINSLQEKVKSVAAQIEATDAQFQQQMKPFLEVGFVR